MAVAMFFLPMMDAIAKWLSTVDTLPPATVTLSRFVVQTILTLIIVLALTGVGSLRPVKLWGNLFRGFLMESAACVSLRPSNICRSLTPWRCSSLSR